MAEARNCDTFAGCLFLPISYVQTRAPKHRPRNWCVYTPEGRAQVHKSLEKVNLSILHYLMEHPVSERKHRVQR